MASTINATTASGGGIISTADASGVLQLQTDGTTAVTIDGSQNVGIGVTPIAGTKLIVNGGYTAFQFNSGTGPTYPTYNSYFGAIGTNFQVGASYLDFWNNVGSGFQWHIQSGASTQTSVLTINSAGNVLVTSPAGLGYGTGSGSTVTQATSKSTAVTLNKPTGQITMNGAALAAGASVLFIINNSIVSSLDTVIATGTNQIIDTSYYRIEPIYVSAGTIAIRVTNVTAGSRSETVQINFAIIRGATA